MYSEHSLARKGIIAVTAALVLAAASSALAEPRWTRMGPVDMPMPLGNDVARELVPPAPAEAQATPAPVAATESEVIALRNQVGVLSRRLADVEEQLNSGDREPPTTPR